ncbi:hypothetical protein V1478_014548 [Vespula squamosa]|uniref:Uncharacterized protein n=1 Tax=Vespula squamosa TaxID=30214 RepID=A0ABD2A989_VESSQ
MRQCFFPWRLDVAAPVFRHQPFYGTTLDASTLDHAPYRSATLTRINEIFHSDEKKGGEVKKRKIRWGSDRFLILANDWREARSDCVESVKPSQEEDDVAHDDDNVAVARR